MSLWQDKEDQSQPSPRTTMSDVIFKIECHSLPVDHACDLSTAISNKAPWLLTSDGAGVHPIHVAGTQNGWQRPDAQSGEPLILSKRTRLRIRVPVDQTSRLIDALSDTEHTIGDQTLKITSGRPAALQSSATLFSRYTIYADGCDGEESFLQRVVDDCNRLGFQPTKLLCGMSNELTTPSGLLEAKSVLIADVPVEYSMLLQEKGLGDFRLMGCGIVIPHKGTDAVG